MPGDTSLDGNCGSNSDTNATCLLSQWGNCCSEKGFCGNSTAYCAIGCQLDFGECNDASVQTVSDTGSCGSTLTSNVTCLGSTYGDCCSAKGYCGGTAAYCKTGCQDMFGKCEGDEDDEEEEEEEEETTSSSASESTTTLTSTTTSSIAESTSTSTTTTSGTSTATPSPVLGSGSGSGEGGLSTGAIVGISIGAAAGLAAIAFLLWFLLFRKRRSSAGDEDKLVEDVKEDPVFVTHEIMNGKEMHEMEARNPRQEPVELPGN